MSDLEAHNIVQSGEANTIQSNRSDLNDTIDPLNGEVTTNAQSIQTNHSLAQDQTATILLMKEQLADLVLTKGRLEAAYSALNTEYSVNYAPFGSSGSF